VIPGKDTYFNKLHNYHWDRPATNHVWYFTLVIFLFNGTVNAIQQTDFLTTIFPELLSKVSVFQIAYPSVFTIAVVSANALLGVWAIIWYNLDAKRRLDRLGLNNQQTRRALLSYFGPVGLLVGSEHEFSMHWEHYDANNLLANLVKVLHGWSGQRIVIVVLAVTAIVCLANYYRDQLSAVLPNVVRGRVLVSIVVLIIIGIIVAAFITGGGNSSAAGPGPVLSASD
jgi:hypothetical protein